MFNIQVHDAGNKYHCGLERRGSNDCRFVNLPFCQRVALKMIMKIQFVPQSKQFDLPYKTQLFNAV
jgi:hypothetical protein